MAATTTSAVCVMKNTILAKENNSLVNTLVFNQVIPSLLRLCLEYGVHNRGSDQVNGNLVHKDNGTSKWVEKIDKRIRDFVQNEEMERPFGWFAKNSTHYRKSYLELDATSLIEIIPKVTDIENNIKIEHFMQLTRSLKGIKYLRNKVIHEKEVAFSEDKIGLISEKINSVVNQLGHIYDISDTEFDRIKKHFEKEISEISAKGNQNTNEDTLIGNIQRCLLQEVPEKWAQIVTQSMKSLLLSDNRLQVCMSDIFHDTDFEVKSDVNNLGSLDPQDRKSFPSSDIFSSKNVANLDIIEGDSGSGKTTFLKKLCLDFCKKIDNNAHLQFKSISSFELMFHFNCQETLNTNSFWQYFTSVFRGTAENFPEYWVIRALKDMKILIAVDGIDECNEASEELIKDIIHNFSDSEKVKFLITTRPGFSKMVINQFHFQTIKPRVLNIKPIKEIKEQEIFIKRVINQLPEINGEEIMRVYNDKQVVLQSLFVRPIGLILFITLFHCCSDEIKKESQKLDLMQLTFNMLSKNIAGKLSTVVNSLQRASLIMNMTGRYSLQWIQNKKFEINEAVFKDLKLKVFKELGFINDGGDEVSIDSLLMCVFQRQESAARNRTIYIFFHRSLQEYLASKVLTEKLLDTRGGSVLEILQELTGNDVRREDLNRQVWKEKYIINIFIDIFIYELFYAH